MRKFLYVLGVAAIVAGGFAAHKFLSAKKVDMSAVDFISRDSSLGVARVRSGRKWALIDKDNNMLTGFDYELMDPFVEKKLVMRKDGKYGMLGADGKEAIRPVYTLVLSSRGNLSLVALNGKWGIVNGKGVEIVPPDYYDDISPFDVNGHARAVNYADQVSVLLDMRGKVVENLNDKGRANSILTDPRAKAKAKAAAAVAAGKASAKPAAKK
jgi:hypothetical protein